MEDYVKIHIVLKSSHIGHINPWERIYFQQKVKTLLEQIDVCSGNGEHLGTNKFVS